jgi:hypothetical protein
MPLHHSKTKLKKGRQTGRKAAALTPIRVIGHLLWQILFFWLPRRRWLRITILSFIAVILLTIGTMYGIARWYIHSQAGQPTQYGVSFIPDYAQSLGLDPQQTMDALLNIGVKHFRLVSYWSDTEPAPGQYDFSQLDWEFAKADAAHAHIILTVGLRQPRWPECHPPSWVDTTKPDSQWQPQLEQFMTAVINRYKGNPALESYQLENEYFLHGFGLCTDQTYDRQRLVSEYKLIKNLDPAHDVIVGRSDNAIGIPVGQPHPDGFSISIYRRVWDANVTHRYLEYPFPAWFYAFLAGWQELADHKNMMIGELQAEAWAPHGQTITETPLAEQSKSINAQRLKDVFQYGRATGMKQIDLWGAEYWYYRLKVLHDPSLWDVAHQEFSTCHK